MITARGGSKSVPGKNLRKINGISLVGFKAISALRSKNFSRLIISTDSKEIQEDAKSYGVEVPFTRPADLATDDASSMGVISHAMDWIEQNSDEQYDAVMLLEPSSPLATSLDYDNAIDLMVKQDANVVLGMRETAINTAFIGPMDNSGKISLIVDQLRGLQKIRRQDMSPEFTMNGGLYLFKWDYFKKHGSLYEDRDNTFGYVMDRHYSIEIDELIDLQWIEFLVASGKIDMSHWA